MEETILVIEDDRNIAIGLRHNLRYEGYDVHIAGDGELGLELAQTKKPALILLDVMLPKINGFEVLRTLRKTDKETPVIILTAKGGETDIVRGLELGADDYVTKPFGLPELLARIAAVLRRRHVDSPSPDLAEFGTVKVDMVSRIVTVNGNPVETTAREFNLIRYFLDREGAVVTRQQILNAVWGFDYFGTDRTVDNFVKRLREKIEVDPKNSAHIHTVRGVGYRFTR